jgi:hypothetical protein
VGKTILRDEKHFLSQPQLPSQSDATCQPNFHPMAQGQVNPPRQLPSGHAPANQPLLMAFFISLSAEIEFALILHDKRVRPSIFPITSARCKDILAKPQLLLNI